MKDVLFLAAMQHLNAKLGGTESGKQLEIVRDYVRQLEQQAGQGWRDVGTIEPDKEVLLLIENKKGKKAVIKGFHLPKLHKPGCGEFDNEDYDEGSDTYFYPEGYYEQVENWPEWSFIPLEDDNKVIGWQPLPPLPTAPADRK